MGGVGPQAPEPQMAQVSPQTTREPGMAQALLAAGPVPTGEAAPAVLRDPRLDELLAAHRAAAGASALGNAGGFLRNATFEGPAR
jgi:sigma-E factor negative regulatory protein RseA